MTDNFIEDDEEDSVDRRHAKKYLSSINRRLSHGINEDDSDSNSTVIEANFEEIEKEEMYTARVGEEEDYLEELREKNKKN